MSLEVAFCLCCLSLIHYFGGHRSIPPAVALVRKLVAVLESIERLPVYSYDSSSAGYGLQV